MYLILTPEVFGEKHIYGSLTMIIFIAVMLLLALKLNWKSTTVIKGSALLLIFLELIKYAYFLKNDGTIPQYIYPIQLCSLSLYVMPIVAFSKGKLNKFVLPFTYAVGLIAASLVFIYPSTVLGNTDHWFPYTGDFLPFQSFFYHGDMLFFSLYLILSKTYQPKMKDIFRAFLLLLLSATVANILNFVWDQNYMLLRTGNGNPFGFVIESYGYIYFLLLMVLLGIILLSIVFSLSVIKKKKSH